MKSLSEIVDFFHTAGRDTPVTVLSSPMVLTVGLYQVMKIDLECAKFLCEHQEVKNYCPHQTVKLLGLEPSTTRDACEDYEVAICIKTKGRLEFGKEYNIKEIESIGYDIFHIRKVNNSMEDL